ncbi:DUF308 domain-containing protein [Clostridia bacterium OttesenSCG-928-O13]|nr:DUF308 domain-containing protein [Clostridia bacterium OttesenSCG-928-O13]
MRQKSNFGWLELILGILLIALGIYTFTAPTTALTSVVILYGIMAIVTGIADIVIYVKLERRTGFGPTLSLVAGIFSILAGFLILFNPGAGTWAVAILFPIWFIAHCISRLAGLGVTRVVAGKASYYCSLIINILGLLLGLMLLFNPWASALSVGYIIGFYLVLLGVGSLVREQAGANEP